MISMVESRVERGGNLANERRYFPRSTTLDAATFGRAA